MSLIGKWDTRELDKFAEKLKGLSEEKVQKFNEDTVKELAARLLAKIIARTPVGEYGTKEVHFFTRDGEEVRFTANSSKVGGTLRRGWTAGEEIDPVEFIMNHTEVIKKGSIFFLIITNPVSYASHIEYGHRTRKKIDGSRGWVDGVKMMTISEDELQDELPGILESKLEKFLGEYFNE